MYIACGGQEQVISMNMDGSDPQTVVEVQAGVTVEHIAVTEEWVPHRTVVKAESLTGLKPKGYKNYTLKKKSATWNPFCPVFRTLGKKGSQKGS